ncbi:MAG: hypothetical protein Q8N53_19790 [Longimicrobiales bacterium]|nr:hypothetical protein [Longimicrobiales bacterium]
MIEVNMKPPDDRAIPPQEIGSVLECVGNRLVRVVLEEDLFLTVRATKRASLRPCPVEIPALERTASSLNEAYSIISREFEPWRRSVAGNVFWKVHYLAERVDGTDHWRTLERLRFQRECEFERQLFDRSSQPAPSAAESSE